MEWIAGIHPVREALKAGRPLERVCVAKEPRSSRLDEIVALARKVRVPVRFESRDVLDRMAHSIPHQGVVAFGSASRHAQLDDFLEREGMLVLLDGVEDPHNLGAIVRTAHAAGALAVIVGERRSAPLSETTAKAAAGALSVLPVIRAANLNRTIEKLKQHLWWIYGLDERGQSACWDTQYEPRSVLVLGAEGHGLHEQIRSKCDFLLRIPMAGAVASLNVSVAAGVALFDWRRKA